MKVYNGKAANGLTKEIYPADEALSYVQTEDSDTLQVYDLRERKENVITSMTEDAYNRKILAYPCQEIKTLHVHL